MVIFKSTTLTVSVVIWTQSHFVFSYIIREVMFYATTVLVLFKKEWIFFLKINEKSAIKIISNVVESKLQVNLIILHFYITIFHVTIVNKHVDIDKVLVYLQFVYLWKIKILKAKYFPLHNTFFTTKLIVCLQSV